MKTIIYDFGNVMDTFIGTNIKSWSCDPAVGYSSIQYEPIDGFVIPTEAELIEQAKVLQAGYDAQEYARSRKAEYPEMADQLDMIYWDGVNETTTHKDAIDAIKTKYPKP